MYIRRGKEEREFLLVSHRGGRGFGPENTLQALREAVKHGVDMVETDVRMSGDGVPLIHHGPFLGLHLISRLPFRSIREKCPHIPTLEEYLREAGDNVDLNLEVKRVDTDAFLETLDKNASAEPPLISSFDHEFIVSLARRGYPGRLGLLFPLGSREEDMIERTLSCGARYILPIHMETTSAVVDKSHRQGLKVIAWTINDVSDLADLLDMGADGAITDEYLEMENFLRRCETEGGSSSRLPAAEAFGEA
jgi:glycerophosphoryl diester phosphodiesterase